MKHGGKAQPLTAPNAKIQSELLIEAYLQANIPIETVSYIETHGTGTKLGDPAEIEGLKLAFSKLQQSSLKRSPATSTSPITPTTPFCGLGSVKTNVGHLEPAAGIVGIIKVLLSMQHQQLPGTVPLNVNPHIQLENSPFLYCKGDTTLAE